MRTTRWVGAIVSTMVLLSIALAPSASAKGERGSVTVTVPGSEDVKMRKDDAAEFVYVTGLWEGKWDSPNVDIGGSTKTLFLPGLFAECFGQSLFQLPDATVEAFGSFVGGEQVGL